MKKAILFGLLLVAIVLSACASPTPAATEVKSPTVTLNRVEVQPYFAPPWPDWPAAIPSATPPPAGTPTPAYVPANPASPNVAMVLNFVWDINNPNDVPVTLEQMKFTVEFEAAPSKPGEFFAVQSPVVSDKLSVPAKTTNQLRVVTVLNGANLTGMLLVTSGQRLVALGITNPAPLIRDWWTNIPDGKFGIKASAGTADFNIGGKTQVVTFTGKFPK